MEEHGHSHIAEVWEPERRNPYGRVNVRGNTRIVSPTARDHKRAVRKASRKNIKHSRRVSK